MTTVLKKKKTQQKENSESTELHHVKQGNLHKSIKTYQTSSKIKNKPFKSKQQTGAKLISRSSATVIDAKKKQKEEETIKPKTLEQLIEEGYNIEVTITSILGFDRHFKEYTQLMKGSAYVFNAMNKYALDLVVSLVSNMNTNEWQIIGQTYRKLKKESIPRKNLERLAYNVVKRVYGVTKVQNILLGIDNNEEAAKLQLINLWINIYYEAVKIKKAEFEMISDYRSLITKNETEDDFYYPNSSLKLYCKKRKNTCKFIFMNKKEDLPFGVDYNELNNYLRILSENNREGAGDNKINKKDEPVKNSRNCMRNDEFIKKTIETVKPNCTKFETSLSSPLNRVFDLVDLKLKHFFNKKVIEENSLKEFTKDDFLDNPTTNGTDISNNQHFSNTREEIVKTRPMPTPMRFDNFDEICDYKVINTSNIDTEKRDKKEDILQYPDKIIDGQIPTISNLRDEIQPDYSCSISNYTEIIRE